MAFIRFYFSRQSSVLLTPLAPMVTFINHAWDAGANAEVDWSFHDRMPNDHDLHDMTVDQLREQESPSIVMQITATRDIKTGEEIFINYGEQWEVRWLAPRLIGVRRSLAHSLAKRVLITPFPIAWSSPAAPTFRMFRKRGRSTRNFMRQFTRTVSGR